MHVYMKKLDQLYKTVHNIYQHPVKKNIHGLKGLQHDLYTILYVSGFFTNSDIILFA
jgi:lantibiotic modifying enzyme